MVEYVSESQLEKYENLIKEINSEHEKCEALKKVLQQQNDKITFSKLSGNDLCTVCLVNVKIFSNIFELVTLYQNELKSESVDRLLKYENCKFYLIEIYFPKMLQEKILDSDCFVNVLIQHGSTSICKSFKFVNNVPVIDVIAVNENVCVSLLEAYFVVPFEFTLRMQKINVNVSHHIHTFKEKNKLNNLDRTILHTNKAYKKSYDINELRHPLLLTYQFKSFENNFSIVLLQNCYHQLNMELFSEINPKSLFTVPFSTGYNKHMISFYPSLNTVTINSNVDDLYNLKMYFLSKLLQGKINHNVYNYIKEMLEKLNSCLYMEDISELYKEVRKFYIDFII